MDISVSVLIPVYNEAHSIGSLVKEIKTLYPAYEVIVINDGSTDASASIAEAAGGMVLNHPYNMGNGASVKTGIRVASGDVLVTMDGDGQHDPKDIAKLISYIPDYDMVVGERSLSGQASLKRAIGNTFYNSFASYVAKFKVKDLTSGFRAVKRKVVTEYLPLFPNTYSYPTTLTLAVLRGGYSMKYSPIHVRTRKNGKSGIHIVKDGTRFLMIIIKICTLYSPLRVFLPVSFGMFLLGAVNYIFTYVSSSRFTNMSALLFVASLLIFMMGFISEQVCQMNYDKTGHYRLMGQSKIL